MPRISMIVTVQKGEAGLRRCVDSILNQSYRNFDLVLVDDGCPDACPCICDEYEDTDPRVHTIHRKAGGLSAARNTGLEWVLRNSDSQWVAFLGSDAWVHRDFLETLVPGTCADAGISALGSGGTDGTVPEVRYLSAMEAYCGEYDRMLPAWGKLVRKDLLETLRFPEDRSWGDGFVTHCLTFEAETVAMVDADLCYTDPAPRGRWSPRRLEELEAHEQRLPYLQVRGYEEAFRRELEAYADALCEQTETVTRLARTRRQLRPCCKALRLKLRHALSMGRKQGLFPRGQATLRMDLLAWPSGPLQILLNRNDRSSGES